jgi:pimeloyl-ACP methyl ester carboxylesterase
MNPETLPEKTAPDAGNQRPGANAAPAEFPAELAAYDRDAAVGVWEGPHYRVTYRVLGQGPPLVLVPGVAATYRVYVPLLNRLARRFRTVIYAYPGDDPGDGARLDRVTHEGLVEDLFGLLDHLGLDRAFLYAHSFGSTVALRALHRRPGRFPAAVLQGGFAHRRFGPLERLSLLFGRRFAGRTLSQIPLHDSVLIRGQRGEFPAALADRWDHFVRENGLTPILSLAHRLDLVSRLDLRPILPAIPTDILLIQGGRDRLVTRRHYEALRGGLPRAEGRILPGVGHLAHYTHAEELTRLITAYLVPRVLSCPSLTGVRT